MSWRLTVMHELEDGRLVPLGCTYAARIGDSDPTVRERVVELLGQLLDDKHEGATNDDT